MNTVRMGSVRTVITVGPPTFSLSGVTMTPKLLLNVHLDSVVCEIIIHHKRLPCESKADLFFSSTEPCSKKRSPILRHRIIQ